MLKQVLIFVMILFGPVVLFSQQPDSLSTTKDSLKTSTAYNVTINNFLKNNKLLNVAAPSVSVVLKINNKKDYQALFFYTITGLALLLAFFKFFYTKYFNNLFRVFFNTSLRQSQLTDQLLQAKLPSLFFNIFFVMAGGVYVFFLLSYFNWLKQGQAWLNVSICVVAVATIYFTKYLTLKFTGWLTSYSEPVNTYVFIVFLINKILGIFLIPFIIIIAFSAPVLATSAIFISLFLIGLMLLLRYFRSYSLLQNKLKVSKLHFFLYIAGIEIIPLLLIYKGLMVLLNKNI